MPYEYHPKDPRAKLREIVAKYLANMRVAGRRPNRGVIFDGSQREEPQASGWLVADRRSDRDGERYLLMEDGDVLCAGPQGSTGASPELDAAVAAWLAGPSDDLVTLLARSLADARMGGTGWLTESHPEAVERVPDRRTVSGRPAGQERRRS